MATTIEVMVYLKAKLTVAVLQSTEQGTHGSSIIPGARLTQPNSLGVQPIKVHSRQSGGKLLCSPPDCRTGFSPSWF